MATQSTLTGAVLTLSEDGERASTILRTVGALERRVFLDTLRPLNVARWAVLVHRFSSDPAYVGEFSSDEVRHARNLSRRLLAEVA